MTNLKHLIGEMRMHGGYQNRYICNLVNFHLTRTWCDGKCIACKLSNPLRVLEYLNEEYKESIELSQMEYDLLYLFSKYFNEEDIKLCEHGILIGMKGKGYFKNVDLELTFSEVLERATINDETN